MDGQNKNLIFATVLSFFVILTWFFLFPPEELPQNLESSKEISSVNDDSGLLPPVINSATGLSTNLVIDSTENQTAPRIEIDTPKLKGSISLRGGKIDELSLKTYFISTLLFFDHARSLEPKARGLSSPKLFVKSRSLDIPLAIK